MNTDSIRLEPSWKEKLIDEFSKPHMQQLKQFLLQEKQAGKVIYPKGEDIFNAFAYTPFDKVKIVILGQDPYHGPNQAHGLSFSVRPGIKTPPSLVNMYKELATDIGFQIPNHGNLTHWAQQGVLLLNAVLTVQQSMANSHQGKGWELFTDRVVETVNELAPPTVFMLWGSYAQKKGRVIDPTKHLVLKAPHPSPLSAHRGFFGCKHFSQANAWLESIGRGGVEWQLPG